jgi:hypothetical protein
LTIFSKDLLGKIYVGITNAIDFPYLNDLELFWGNRNTCLHQLVKSAPGTATQDFHEMMTLAYKTAISGKSLCKKVSNWSQKYKNIIEKSTQNN